MQHQKDRHYLHASRDLCVVAEEGDSLFAEEYNQSYLSHVLDSTVYNKPSFESIQNATSERSALPMQRARAGTMPSLDSTPLPFTSSVIMPSTSLSFLNNRNRSGSLNLPTYNGWSISDPASPTSAELPQGDDIARTLRSLGLDDDKDTDSSSSPLSTHLATPPVGGILPLPQQKQPQRSTLRSRSYSVNNTGIYQSMPSPFINGLYNAPHPLPSLSVDPIPLSSNRPRASSMSRMDHSNRINMSSLWKMQLGTLHDDSTFPASPLPPPPPPPPVLEPSLSLGDSEFLANILHQSNQHSVSRNTDIETLNQFTPVPTGSLSTSMFNNSNASRSLWVGNIDASMAADELTAFFSKYGPVESTRLLLEKECAFVNFYHLEDAVHAKEDILTNLGGRIGSCIVRVGYGRTESTLPNVTTMLEQPVVSQPTRALWLGNLPTGTTQATLERVFSLFGRIESIRVLTHKNCAFVNFEASQSANDARDALVRNDESVKEFWGIRLGFAKVPSNSNLRATASKHALLTEEVMEEEQESNFDQELWCLMSQLGAKESAIQLVKAYQPFNYRDSIPPVPEYGPKRKHDIGKLRDIRKKLDNFNSKEDTKQADTIALDCMNEIAEICSDYIGNTVVQRLFEKCSENIKTMMLEMIAPHLAALGVHKNGTWAAQKIIDSMTTPKQIQIVFVNIQPFIPALLLDQFGNYVVQCCLRLKGNTQFIMNAMIEKCLPIAQGRFGARAIRGILESELLNSSERIFIMAALLQNATLLATHSNGALLISWLIDSSSMQNRHRLLASQLIPHLIDIATHKLGSQILLKLVNQDTDQEAKRLIFSAVIQQNTLQIIVSDQTRGLGFILKLLASDCLEEEEKNQLKGVLCSILKQLPGAEYEKALAEVGDFPGYKSSTSQK